MKSPDRILAIEDWFRSAEAQRSIGYRKLPLVEILPSTRWVCMCVHIKAAVATTVIVMMRFISKLSFLVGSIVNFGASDHQQEEDVWMRVGKLARAGWFFWSGFRGCYRLQRHGQQNLMTNTTGIKFHSATPQLSVSEKWIVGRVSFSILDLGSDSEIWRSRDEHYFLHYFTTTCS